METRESTDALYRLMVEAFTADKRDRVIPLTGLRKRVIKLDNAMVEEPLGIKGDYVYCDFNSTGVAELSLNNTSEDAFPLLALSGVERIPYDGAFISCAAQPGLVINLWYGYNSQFISPTSAIATIGSITNPVKIQDTSGDSIDSKSAFGSMSSADRYLLTQDGGSNYASSYISNTLLGVGTANAVLPASNVNGMVVVDAESQGGSAAALTLTLLAKSSAPATIIDGEPVLSLLTLGGTIGMSRRNRPLRISSGKGLYHTSNAIMTASLLDILYSLF